MQLVLPPFTGNQPTVTQLLRLPTKVVNLSDRNHHGNGGSDLAVIPANEGSVITEERLPAFSLMHGPHNSHKSGRVRLQ